VLPTILRNNCDPNQVSGGGFNDAGVKVGEKAVNFTLKDVNGNETRLSQLLAEKPVIMVFGSFT
jgi:cytochrome oxidase Cu insertion factor (SCO1/SenC/PrrC family)